MKLYSILFICFFLLTENSAAASIKSELNQLEARMQAIKKQLSFDQSSRDKVYQNLAVTEKELSKDLHEMHLLTIQEKQKKQEIDAINKQLASINIEVKKQEQILARHLRARHKLGAIHPWQWLVQQDTLRTMSRLFVFYQYLFQADQKVIAKVRETSSKLSITQTKLSHEKQILDELEEKLAARQKNLAMLKGRQQTLINTLDKQIQSKHQQLKAFNQDKARLQALVKKLSVRPTRPATKPTTITINKIKNSNQTLKLQGKYLKNPLQNSSTTTKALNQGLVFMANEGTPVFAVLPGKIVFSDWLKGYGLLLIVDHGDGIMSLYAHNASLFAALGRRVKQGEQIATVGHTGGLRENGLYFELRRRGRAVPPREWMP